MGKTADIFKSITEAIVGGATGGVTSIAQKVMDYFPPSMSDKEKAELQLKISQQEAEKDLRTMAALNEAKTAFFEFTKDFEGTAKDLKDVRFFGPLMLFLRGSQRIVWGYGTLWIDFQVISGGWAVQDDPQLKFLAIALTIIVGATLFGERAIQNVMPLLERYFGIKKQP